MPVESRIVVFGPVQESASCNTYDSWEGSLGEEYRPTWECTLVIRISNFIRLPNMGIVEEKITR